MRMKAITKCAVGAMLFGGTLGAASTAQAGFAWTNARPTGSYDPSVMEGSIADISSYDAYSGQYGSQVRSLLSGALAQGSWNGSYPGFGASVNWTATGSAGDLTANISGAAGAYTSLYVYRWFQVTGTQTVQMSVSGGLYGDLFRSGTGVIWESTDSVSKTMTLNAGFYNIRFFGAFLDQAGSASANFTVPAPGAMALLGAAGLVGSRRRRG
jgi:MYXO-CTERM domain-containing protein